MSQSQHQPHSQSQFQSLQTRKSLGRILSGQKRLLAATIIGLVALGGLVTTPAVADHNDHRYGGRIVSGPGYNGGYYGGRRGGHGHNHRNARWTAVEFKHGYDLGATQGMQRGYRDASNGKRYCDTSGSCRVGASRPFHRGFTQAYRGAYKKGWEFGRSACSSHGFGPGYLSDY